MGGLLVHLAHRNLVRAPVVFSALAVDLLWAGPAVRGAEHDHRPPRPAVEAVPTRISFDALDLPDNSVERGSHQLVHLLGLASLHEVQCVPVTAEKVVKFLVANPG